MFTYAMDKESFLEFLAKAHANTYAASREIKQQHKMETPFLPGHKCYYFPDGSWEYFDGYAGSLWAPGREVVLFEGSPVWSMAYQGQTIEGPSVEFFDEAFEFLKKALRTVDVRMPFRGPKTFSEGDFHYSFSFKGDWSYFVGRENITRKGKEIFFQDVMASQIK